MARVLTDDSNYTALAGVIRQQTGTSEKYYPSQMAPTLTSMYTELLDYVEAINGNSSALQVEEIMRALDEINGEIV